jgi:hypothetical protein
MRLKAATYAASVVALSENTPVVVLYLLVAGSDKRDPSSSAA